MSDNSLEAQVRRHLLRWVDAEGWYEEDAIDSATSGVISLVRDDAKNRVYTVVTPRPIVPDYFVAEIYRNPINRYNPVAWALLVVMLACVAAVLFIIF